MSDGLEQAVRELKDRQEIYDCLVRYCHGVDKFDRDMIRSAYHDDAVDDHGEFVGPVDDFIDWALNYHATHQKRTMHAIHTHRCELDGDTAHTETYWTFYALNKQEPHHTRAYGRYVDRFEKRDGRWGIVARYCLLTGLDAVQDAQAMAGDAYFVPSTRDTSDPAYMRPLEVDRSRFTKPATAEG